MKKNNYKVIAMFFVACLFVFSNVYSQANYNWKQVRIGGGGYITGMKIHPNNNNVRYFRTDVGGAYKWDAAKNEMVQILNFGSDKKNYYGVAGIALHPTKQNIVYLAVDRGNTTQTSKILYSEDYGNNWQEIDVTGGIKFGANGGREGGTGINDIDREGSPIAINPLNTNELWVGTREKGVWVLDLTKATPWRKISDIPDNNQEASVRAIIFHPVQPRFIFVAYASHGIYRSSNSGSSFKLINHGSDDLKLVSDLSISKNGTELYAAVRNKGIYRIIYPATDAPWTKLNIPFADVFRGYLTVTTSPYDNMTVVACPASAVGNNLQRFQVSTDAGETWTTKSNVNFVNTFEWDSDDNVGAYTSQIAFDPSNNGKIYMTGWFGLWHTNDWRASQVAWRNNESKGHEEIVSSGLVTFRSNSSNNTLGVNSADYPAVIVKNPDSFDNSDIRSLMNNPTKAFKGQDIAIADTYPNNFAISTTDQWTGTAANPTHGSLFLTKNGGQSYTKLTSYNPNWGKSLVGMSTKDPNNIVVVHGKEIHYSRDGGTTFSKATTPTLNTVVEDNVFMRHRPFAQDLEVNHLSYLYDRVSGFVYRSENGGQNWFKTSNGLPNHASNPWTSASLKATPKNSGHLWFNHPAEGLYRSTNKGDTWTKISNVKRAKVLALGKSMTNNGYPTIYIVGELNGSPEGIYRSTDQGASWTRLDGANTKFLLSGPRHLAADRNVFGKVYLGLDGMGVWQGVISNGLGLNNKAVNKDEVRLYPVPVDDILNIDFGNSNSEKSKWQLFDMNGRFLKEGKSNQIEVGNLSKGGMYIVVISSGNQTTVKKIIK